MSDDVADRARWGRRRLLQEEYLRTTCIRCRTPGCPPGEELVEGGELVCKAESPCGNPACGSLLRLTWPAFDALRNEDLNGWQDALDDMARHVRENLDADAFAQDEVREAPTSPQEPAEADPPAPSSLRLKDGSTVPWAVAERAYGNYVRLYGWVRETVKDMEGCDPEAFACLLAGHGLVKGHAHCLANLEALKERP